MVVPREPQLSEGKDLFCQHYLDTDDPEWYDLSKEEARLIKECEAELAIRIRQDNAPKEAEDFLAELENIAAAWDTMLQSDEGRQNIIRTYVERIDIFDPEPDEPGKCRIDLLIRTDPGAECAERIQSEVECAVRNCEKEVHHKQRLAQQGGPLFYPKRRTRIKLDTNLFFLSRTEKAPYFRNVSFFVYFSIFLLFAIAIFVKSVYNYNCQAITEKEITP